MDEPYIFTTTAWKHQVDPAEVEEALNNRPKIRFVEKGEDVYMALGRSCAGRYLAVLFVYKKTREALILSARDMVKRERRQYGKK
ncbi:MAG: BrnT family toxin [Acidobacteria bacterium]|nr:BrnT family toxin [Acidobacteriota bacterium]MBI3427138.1 BrnT family toxin [Acidobacteriota bacterium]